MPIPNITINWPEWYLHLIRTCLLTSNQAITVGAFHSANGVPAARASASKLDFFLIFLSSSLCPELPDSPVRESPAKESPSERFPEDKVPFPLLFSLAPNKRPKEPLMPFFFVFARDSLLLLVLAMLGKDSSELSL